MYSNWGQRCHNQNNGSRVDRVDLNSVDGYLMSGTCWPPPYTAVTELADVYGGTVEHVRKASVRGRVQLRYPYWPWDLTVTLAIQAYGASGWQDIATSQASIGAALAWYEVEASVDPGTDVRLQVRANWLCQARPSEAYDLRAALIDVETCVPDLSHPGSCL